MLPPLPLMNFYCNYYYILLKDTEKDLKEVTLDQNDHIYDEVRQRENQDDANVYSYTEPVCYCPDNDTYNHLHQKQLLVSDGLYGLPKIVSISIDTPLQDHKL